jgi:pSer/pThr/pTyr-binding forkhead associated (FHA) protein
MPARLVALNGAADIPLTGLLTVAGRHPGCDARLDSSRVSRRHCCLALGDGGVIVRDLGSTNGTWVNGRRVEEGVLRPGDVLEIAHLRFRLVLPDPAATGRPAEMRRAPEPDPIALARESAQDTAPHDPEPFDGRAPHPGAPGPE